MFVRIESGLIQHIAVSQLPLIRMRKRERASYPPKTLGDGGGDWGDRVQCLSIQLFKLLADHLSNKSVVLAVTKSPKESSDNNNNTRKREIGKTIENYKSTRHTACILYSKNNIKKLNFCN